MVKIKIKIHPLSFHPQQHSDPLYICFFSSFTSLHSFAFVGWNQILFKMFTFQIRPRSCMTNALLICAPPSEAITCRCKVLFLFFIFYSVILISGCLILILIPWFWFLVAWFWFLIPWFWFLVADFDFWLFDFDFWLPDFDFWLLDFDFWLLDCFPSKTLGNLISLWELPPTLDMNDQSG